MIYDEKLVDLGPHGLLALTLGDSAAMPLPAQHFGYARWIDAGGAGHDRFDLCTRRLPRDVVEQSLALERSKRTYEVPMMGGRVDWCARHDAGAYVEAPTSATALGDALVLLIFAGITGRALLRIVDAQAGSIVFEEATADLCGRLGIKPPAHDKGALDQPVLLSCGSRHFNMRLGNTGMFFAFHDGVLGTSNIADGDRGWDSAFCASHLMRETEDEYIYQIVPLGAQADAASVKSKHHTSTSSCTLTGAAGAGRFALVHTGGTVEVLDAQGALIGACRPSARATGREEFEIGLSFAGRYLTAVCGEEAWVVDLAQDMVASIVWPANVRRGHFDWSQFSPEVLYQCAVSVTDGGIFTLAGKALSHVAFADLDWSPVIRPGQRAKKAGTAEAAYKKALPGFVRPALAFKALKGRDASASFMYGLPSFPAGEAWPEHGGHRMQLLCQVDLGDAAELLAPDFLPPAGRLLFFVSVNEEGELAQDDEMAPQAVRVLLLPTGAAAPAEGTITHRNLDFKPVRLVRDRSVLPQPDAAIVTAQNFSDLELEAYREYFEKKVPDGLSEGNRMGGYPAILQSNDLEAAAAFKRDGCYPASCDEAARWHLLMQFESDVFMWGTDMGILYFMIHEDDLLRRDFSRAVGICAGS